MMDTAKVTIDLKYDRNQRTHKSKETYTLSLGSGNNNATDKADHKHILTSLQRVRVTSDSKLGPLI